MGSRAEQGRFLALASSVSVSTNHKKRLSPVIVAAGDPV